MNYVEKMMDALRPSEAEGKVITYFKKYAAIAREKGATHMSISCDDFDALVRSEQRPTDTDQRSMPATDGEKSLNGQVETPSASNLPSAAGSSGDEER